MVSSNTVRVVVGGSSVSPQLSVSPTTLTTPYEVFTITGTGYTPSPLFGPAATTQVTISEYSTLNPSGVQVFSQSVNNESGNWSMQWTSLRTPGLYYFEVEAQDMTTGIISKFSIDSALSFSTLAVNGSQSAATLLVGSLVTFSVTGLTPGGSWRLAGLPGPQFITAQQPLDSSGSGSMQYSLTPQSPLNIYLVGQGGQGSVYAVSLNSNEAQGTIGTQQVKLTLQVT